MSALYYGVTKQDLCKLAYQVAERNKIAHSFNEDRKMAGTDWFYGFLKRNPDLTMRIPEATSLSRVIGFRRSEVNRFYDNLRQVFATGIKPGRIYNVALQKTIEPVCASQYAAPAWSEMCSSADHGRLDSLLRRSKRLGYSDNDLPSIADLFNSADVSLTASRTTPVTYYSHICLTNSIYLTNFEPAHTPKLLSIKQNCSIVQISSYKCCTNTPIKYVTRATL